MFIPIGNVTWSASRRSGRARQGLGEFGSGSTAEPVRIRKGLAEGMGTALIVVGLLFVAVGIVIAFLRRNADEPVPLQIDPAAADPLVGRAPQAPPVFTPTAFPGTTASAPTAPPPVISPEAAPAEPLVAGGIPKAPSASLAPAVVRAESDEVSPPVLDEAARRRAERRRQTLRDAAKRLSQEASDEP